MSSNSRGIALILVLMVSVLIFLALGATVLLIRGKGQSEPLHLDSQRALYLAEAGLEYVRAAVHAEATRRAQASQPEGIRMPSLTFVEIVVILKAEVDPEAGFRVGPHPVPGHSGAPVGHFKVRIGLTQDAMGSKDMEPTASVDQPSGLGWLPILFIESTGLLGEDPDQPAAQRRVVAMLRPLPPPVKSPATLPARDVLAPGGELVLELQAEDLYPSLPTYGVPTYEVSDYVDMGSPDPHLWLLDNTAKQPPVYPPASSLPGEPPAPWWFLPPPEQGL